jgi:hypothetical protein
MLPNVKGYPISAKIAQEFALKFKPNAAARPLETVRPMKPVAPGDVSLELRSSGLLQCSSHRAGARPHQNLCKCSGSRTDAASRSFEGLTVY